MHTQAPSDIGRTLASRQGMSCGKRNAPISGVAFVSREKPRNLAASVRQRLFSLAQERREDFGLVLTRYGLERFLYRLAQSQNRDQFILRSEEHTSELQSRLHLVCRLLLEKKKD